MAGLRLDAILTEALCAEREYTNKPVTLSLDTPLLPVEVTYEQEDRVLEGWADYTVWYDKNELSNTQFVVVNTTKGGTMIGTCLAYMGKRASVPPKRKKKDCFLTNFSSNDTPNEKGKSPEKHICLRLLLGWGAFYIVENRW